MKIICHLFILFNHSIIECALFILVAKASLSRADDMTLVCMMSIKLFPIEPNEKRLASTYNIFHYWFNIMVTFSVLHLLSTLPCFIHFLFGTNFVVQNEDNSCSNLKAVAAG